MLSDVLPLMTETVEHWLPPTRDVYGHDTFAGSTSHRARIIYSPGKIVAPASGEDMPNAGATIWLIDHPRPIRIGDTFALPDGETLKAIRVEHRTMAGGRLTKVFLS